MTERLYYHDSYLTEFRARVVDAGPDRQKIYLDRTAFYPSSGGQPFDIGRLSGVEVIDVVDEDDRIAHLLREPLAADEVEGTVDWRRRFDHMQQHTGQHLLSAVLIEMFDATTISFHLGADASTIDITRTLEANQIRKVERRANEIVFQNRPVTVTFRDSSEKLDLRKETEREGMVRIVTIDGLDRSACGGTHVRSTAEIGPILIRKQDRIRGNQRLEFVCGLRAVDRARADYEALSAIARSMSAALDEAPGMVSAQSEKLQEVEKVRRRLATELAQARGRELYAATAPSAEGIRKIEQGVPALSEELRAEAQSFTAGERSIYVAFAENPPAVLLAVSKDSGLNAGEMLKAALTAAGGRGGGSATIAQGSLPNAEALAQVRNALVL